MAPRGRRAWHVIKGNKVNVGDPTDSSEESFFFCEVSANKHKSEAAEMSSRESDGS